MLQCNHSLSIQISIMHVQNDIVFSYSLSNRFIDYSYIAPVSRYITKPSSLLKHSKTPKSLMTKYPENVKISIYKGLR